jgi:hypothetical protein
MDPIVEAALKKWPHVPHCYGWLALDARGDWYMRDDRIQAAGPFPQVKGSRIQHDKLLAFIGRNYGADERGCWFFQNGPQRVYVQLESTPWIWRLQPPTGSGEVPAVRSHTGQAAVPQSAWLDEHGHLYLSTDLGVGLVHTQDMDLAADAVLQGAWTPQALAQAELPGRFGFRRAPAPE